MKTLLGVPFWYVTVFSSNSRLFLGNGGGSAQVKITNVAELVDVSSYSLFFLTQLAENQLFNRKYIYTSKWWIIQPAYATLLEDQWELRACFLPVDIAGVTKLPIFGRVKQAADLW